MSVAQDAMIGALLATDPALVRAADPPPQALERITVPTLAISMEDDRFETAAAARHIAVSVPAAELIVYPTGGHIWIGRQDMLFAAVDAFLSRTAKQKGRP